MPITVNEVRITDDEIHAEMQYHPAPSIDKARQKASESLVIRQLLLQETINKLLLTSIDSSSEEEQEKAIETLIKQEVIVPEADKQACLRYYKSNQQHFQDKKLGETLPFEQVKKHIYQYLHTQSMRTGICHYIKVLAGRALIVGIDFDGSDGGLVQ